MVLASESEAESKDEVEVDLEVEMEDCQRFFRPCRWINLPFTCLRI